MLTRIAFALLALVSTMSHFRVTPAPKTRFRISQEHLVGVAPPSFADNLVLFLLDDPCILAYMGAILHFGAIPDTDALENDVTGVCPRTPNLNSLAKNGRLFKWAFSAPVCSPTRASLLTSVHVFRHGVGDVVRRGNAGELAEYGDPGYVWGDLPTRLKEAGVHSRIFGKKHLSISGDETFDSSLGNGTPQHDGRIGSGFDIILRTGYGQQVGAFGPAYSTMLRNLNQPDGYTPIAGRGYYLYAINRSEFGTPVVETQYATSNTIDEVISFIDGVPAGERFFADVRFNAIHTPYEGENFPPEELVTTEAYIEANNGLTAWPVPFAGMEAIDAEIGRLFAAMDAKDPTLRSRTTFIVMADNGPDAIYYLSGKSDWGKDYGEKWNALIDHTPSFTKMKDSPYRMGGCWPLLVSGPRDVAPQIAEPGSVDETSLVDAVDVPATIADYFGVPWAEGERDGKSLLPAAWTSLPHTRAVSLCESFEPLGDWTQAVTRKVGFRAILTTPFSGLTGLFSLIKPEIGEDDEVYHLQLLDGTEVDEFEESVLDPVTHADLYAELNRLYDELMNSSLGGPGDLFLPFTDRSGGDKVIGTDEDDHVPFTPRSGGQARLEVTNGELIFALRSGGTGRIPLIGADEAGSWALQFLKRTPSPFGYFLLLEPDDTLHFTLRGGGTGRFASVSDAPNPNYIPLGLRAGGTGKLQLVTPP